MPPGPRDNGRRLYPRNETPSDIISVVVSPGLEGRKTVGQTAGLSCLFNGGPGVG